MSDQSKKTTGELLEMMKNRCSYEEYLSVNREALSSEKMRVSSALSAILAEKNAKKSTVIAKSGIEVHYAYQIFSGAKVPSRDKLIMLCFGLSMGPDEVQNLLKCCGYPSLYAKDLRDNAIMFALTKRISIIELNNVLYELGLEIMT